MKDAAAIVGIGETPFAKRLEPSETDLAVEAISKALDDAGVEAALAGVVAGVALGPEDFAERLRTRAALEAAWQRLPAHRTVPAYGQFSVPLSLGAGADPTVWVPVGAP